MRSLVLVTCVLWSSAAFAQKASVVKLSNLQEMIASGDKSIIVINFWATWCAPCVKEMPLFEKLSRDTKDVDIALVSMDMDLDPDISKVDKFISRKKLIVPVLVLDEKNPNDWITKIDKAWSGALPATLVVNRITGARKFIEGELHDGDLEKMISEIK